MKRFTMSSFRAASIFASAVIAVISIISVGAYAAVMSVLPGYSEESSASFGYSSSEVSYSVDDGLVLKNLWKEYRRTREKDLPAKSGKILEDIKSEANSKHLVYDYYKAVNEYVDVVASVNWKLRDSLESKRVEELKAFGEPLLLYVSGIAGSDNFSVLSFLEKNKAALESSSLSGFWQSYPASYKRRALAAYYNNDYEYVLASQMYRNRFDSGSLSFDFVQGGATAALKALFLKGVGSRYPFNALWELVEINSAAVNDCLLREIYLEDSDQTSENDGTADIKAAADKEAALKAFITKYNGKSVTVIAENEILQLHRDNIERDGKATSEQYMNLRAEAAKVVEHQRSFKGKDAELIADESYAKSLVDCLDATSISLNLQNDSIFVILRNLPDAHIRVCSDADGKVELFSSDADNKVRSYYCLDTLCVAAPVLSDGRYWFFASSGKSQCEAYHSRYSLAAQLTSTPEGIYIFLADRNSGKPVEVADMEVVSSEKTIAEASSVKLSGQTVLPREIADSLMSRSGGVRYLRCTSVEDGVTKKTDLLSLYGYFHYDRSVESVADNAAESVASDGESVNGSAGGSSGHEDISDGFESSGNLTLRCNLFLDKSAFYPGETVHFKAVSYYDNGNGKMRTVKEGETVRVVLSDAAGKEVKTASLRTNDYGSIAGSFEIPTGSYRNGNWRISASVDGNVVDVAWLVVDEYELPSFNVTFASDDKLYLSGDTVPVSGKVISYAGNSLSDADISYELWKMSESVGSGKLDLDNSGNFTVQVKTSRDDSWACYRLMVKITDGAGQTKEFTASRTVSNRFTIAIAADDSQFSTGSVVGESVVGGYAIGGYNVGGSNVVRHPYMTRNIRIISGNTLSFSIEASDANGRKVALPSAAEYRIERCQHGQKSNVVMTSGKVATPDVSAGNGMAENYTYRTVAVGDVATGKMAVGNGTDSDVVEIPLKDYPSGLYRVATTCRASSSFTAETDMLFLMLRDEDKAMNAPVESVVKLNENESGLQLQLGAGCCDVWTVVSLYDRQTHLKYTSLVRVGTSSLTSLSVPYPAGYSGNMLLTAVYFKNGRFHSFEHECRRQSDDFVKPLAVSSISDSYSPRTEYVIKLSSDPCTEILASIFDRSTEDIAPNLWSAVTPFTHSIGLNTTADTGEFIFRTSGLWIDGRRFYTKSASMSPAMAGASMRTDSNSALASASDSEFMENDSLPEAAEDAGFGDFRNGTEEELGGAYDLYGMNSEIFRKDFKTVLAFEPFVTTDASGNAEIHFRTSDKLSTYILSLFAHDRNMHNSVCRSEFVVKSPVALTVHAPSFLYFGDRYDMSVSVSNNGSSDISGILTASLPFIVQSAPVTVPAASSKTVKFSVTIPDKLCSGVSLPLDNVNGSPDSSKSHGNHNKMDLKFVFRAKSSDGIEYSDAMLSEVKLLPARQVLTESHSAVYRQGMDKDSLVRGLEKEFVNTSHFGSVHTERTVADIVSDLLSSHVEPSSNNVIDLVKALYSNLMLPCTANLDEYAVSERNVAVKAAARNNIGANSNADENAVARNNMGANSNADENVAAGSVKKDEEGQLRNSAVKELLEKILLCRTESGGFGWYAGMNASPIVTAVVVEDLALMVRSGRIVLIDDSFAGGSSDDNVHSAVLPKEVLTEAVKYIDRCYFSDGADFLWRGGISTEQYVYLRSLFPEIPLWADQIKATSGKKMFSERITQLKNYLCPKTSADKLNGRLLNKARRASAALNFTKSARSCNDGFIASLGNGITLRRINKTLARDIASIKEYAVMHPSGGVYFPNAVLPFRGLLENEAYAHSLICNLLSEWSEMLTSDGCPSFGREFRNGDAVAARIADDVRLWLLLQKDSQKWDTDPAFVNAVNSILSGSESLLSTSVVVLTKTYEKKFSEIKASGNGFKIEKEYLVESYGGDSVNGIDAKDANEEVNALPGMSKTRINNDKQLIGLRAGAELSVGDKVIVRYRIWNGENRSFVRLTIPYNACFRPVSQLSGICGWGSLSPYFDKDVAVGAFTMSGSSYNVGRYSPQGYREVRSDRIVYDFDVFPEETTVIEEVFYVSQSGVFTAPVAEVESLYAPHYRANSSYSSPVVSR